MAESIKLNGDKYIDATGVSIDTVAMGRMSLAQALGTSRNNFQILNEAADANAYVNYYGIYTFFMDSTASNIPVAHDGVILQIRARGDALFQLFFDGWSTDIYTRRCWGTMWVSWTQL